MTRMRKTVNRVHWWYLVLRWFGETRGSAIYWALVIVLIPDPDARFVA